MNVRSTKLDRLKVIFEFKVEIKARFYYLSTNMDHLIWQLKFLIMLKYSKWAFPK